MTNAVEMQAIIDAASTRPREKDGPFATKPRARHTLSASTLTSSTPIIRRQDNACEMLPLVKDPETKDPN